MEETKAYLEDEIDKVLPTIDDVCESMSVTQVIGCDIGDAKQRGLCRLANAEVQACQRVEGGSKSYTAAKGRTQSPALPG
jgi:hypothetical protein